MVHYSGTEMMEVVVVVEVEWLCTDVDLSEITEGDETGLVVLDAIVLCDEGDLDGL